ncbi:MAG TPA: TlpA disulfide reductase family protein [Planococcus sp. (in: firmicutes)]|nr:TlpA disulfide reductase family protein [Planococcus sp. (in: firmicutes)]
MKIQIKILLLAVFVLALAGCSSAPSANNGAAAPDFELVDIQGKSHKLSDYEGQKVYIKFWASWCSICLAGMSELNELAGEENDFAVLSIVSPSSNAEKNSESFKKWFNGVENTENVQVLLDEGGPVFEDYGVLAYPTSVYIGSDGVLVKSSPGHFSNEQIRETFDTIQ